MDYRALYRRVDEAGASLITFDYVGAEVVALTDVEEIHLWAIEETPLTGEAYYVLLDDRSSPYNGEFLIAEISYCSSLDGDLAEQRFMLTKELMHVFDAEEHRTDTREKFYQLLRDLQNLPMNTEIAAVGAEKNARWMALLVLFPKRLRDAAKLEVEAGTADITMIAERSVLPVWAISAALDKYYDEAWALLTQ